MDYVDMIQKMEDSVIAKLDEKAPEEQAVEGTPKQAEGYVHTGQKTIQ